MRALLRWLPAMAVLAGLFYGASQLMPGPAAAGPGTGTGGLTGGGNCSSSSAACSVASLTSAGAISGTTGTFSDTITVTKGSGTGLSFTSGVKINLGSGTDQIFSDGTYIFLEGVTKATDDIRPNAGGLSLASSGVPWTNGYINYTYGVAGTAALPSHTFNGDPNTGMSAETADTLILSTAGTQRIVIGPSGTITTVGTVELGNDLRTSSATDGLIDIGSPTKRIRNIYQSSYSYNYGAPAGTAGSGTGYTLNASGATTQFVHKITITEAALADADGSEDETVWTLPAKSVLHRVVADVTAAFDDAAGPISAVALTCGTSAGGNQLLLSADVYAGAATFGDAAAEEGASITAENIPPVYWSAQAISCRFASTGGNLVDLTTGSVTFYIEGATYP